MFDRSQLAAISEDLLQKIHFKDIIEGNADGKVQANTFGYQKTESAIAAFGGYNED